MTSQENIDRIADSQPESARRSAQLSAAALRAAAWAAAAGKEEARHWLVGVHVEIAPHQVTYVATDGHILFAVRGEAADDCPDNSLVGEWTIPVDVIGKLRKGFTLPLTLNANPDSSRMTLIEDEDDSFGFPPVHGDFPNWRRVIPRRVKQDGPFRHLFDPALLSRLGKAGTAIGAPRPFVALNGAGPALVTYSGATAVRCIMPIRARGETLFEAPAWVHGAE
jgi:hypothetical protein